MQTRWEGQEYRVRFVYGRRGVDPATPPTLTVGVIERRGIGETAWTSVAEGTAVRAATDPFVKETGRLIALRRATAGLAKGLKAAVWAVYLNRRGS